MKIFKNAIGAVKREFRLSYHIIHRDLSSAFIPPLFFSFAAFKSIYPLPVSDFIFALLEIIIYFWLYIYSFALSNQLVGLEEDRVNKPDRALPSGALSIEEAQTRYIVVNFLFTIAGWLMGVLIYTLLWQAATITLNFAGGSKHWFTKSFFMFVGILAQLPVAWQLVTPLTPFAWKWIILIAVVIGLTVNLQDIRDQAGDKYSGRDSIIPFNISELSWRYLIGTSFIILALIIHIALIYFGGTLSLAGWICDAVLAMWCFIIAGRIYFLRTAAADHLTYVIYTYWYCFLALTIFIIS